MHDSAAHLGKSTTLKQQINSSEHQCMNKLCLKYMMALLLNPVLAYSLICDINADKENCLIVYLSNYFVVFLVCFLY